MKPALALGYLLLAIPLSAQLAPYSVIPLTVQWPASGSKDRSINLNTAILLNSHTGETWILAPAHQTTTPSAPLLWVPIATWVPNETDTNPPVQIDIDQFKLPK